MLHLYENIKERRTALRMTQTELAEKAGYADKSMISRIENGEIDLQQSKIIDLANALNVAPGDLMGYDYAENDFPLYDIEKEIIRRFRNLDAGQRKMFLNMLDIKEKGEMPSKIAKAN